MKNASSLSCLLLAATLWPCPSVQAQETPALHVVRTTVNAESENAEFCVEFDRPLASASQARLVADLQLEADDKIVTPQNIATTDSSLCLFPLERGRPYHLKISGLHGTNDEMLNVPYKTAFTIPDRSPALAFTGQNGGVNEFGAYDTPLTLRSINVPRVALEVYHITDPALMAHVWQERAQTTLVPSESAALARSKDKPVWREEDSLDAAPNATSLQEIRLHEMLPQLAPGLYLIVADAGSNDSSPANKGLAPLAAAWFTKSDFSLHAVRDDVGIHVFASRAGSGHIHLAAFSKKPEQLAEAQSGDDGISLIPYPAKLGDKNDLATVVGNDPEGNTAFADIEPLPALSDSPVSSTVAVPPLHVTTNADAPRLDLTSDRDALSGDGAWSVTINSRASSGSPLPLAGGHASIAWQKLDPAAFGWKDYRFGNPGAILGAPAHVADFLTDLQGTATLHLSLPARPPERGLYQAVLKVAADEDSGITDAAPLTLPLRPEGNVIGLKPLAKDARFTQNGLARFALIALSSDGKPRDISGLSYQVYEEGRSFAWYQNEGHWKYRPEAQLRPIGGGPLTVKADASSVLEWRVTAGNYRLEILDPNGKILAQTGFSAGWDSSGADAAPILPLAVQLPKILQPGQEVLAHVTLPEPAMLTALISDARIRKIVHEIRPQGDNTIAFTPAAEWGKTVTLSVETEPKNEGATRRSVVEASIAQKVAAPVPATANAVIVAPDDPAALVLRKDGAAVLTFGIQNNGDASEIYRYVFIAAPGLKIEGGEKGEITINGKQSRSVSVAFLGAALGVKELRLEVTGAHAPRLSQIWPVAVLPRADSLRDVETVSIAPKQNLLPVAAKPREGTVALISRLPMNGLVEILAFVFNARPFTTEELALSVDALRLWGPTLASTGLAPDFLITAQRQEQLAQLLRHQNSDGGFASLRDGDSTIDDTAAALTALGPDASEAVKPAKNLAIGWLKQRLSNTWVDEKERGPRAAAYAALAAADAIDPASLHYFSDTSAQSNLPPVAETHIAAAFKHIHDPDAAAFWIKKMLDENVEAKSISLLNALAATDALSADDVFKARTEMVEALRLGKATSLKDAAALLRATAAGNEATGKWDLAAAKETHTVAGVMVAKTSDAAAASYRNAGAQPLSVTFVADAEAPAPLPQGATLMRHVYRLNGVEMSPSASPAHGEIYMIELKGSAPDLTLGGSVLLQDGSSGLRPLGCPLSPKVGTLSFIPWFTASGVSSVGACEFSARAINAVLAPSANENASFSVVYFARIGAHTIADLPKPQLRRIE